MLIILPALWSVFISLQLIVLFCMLAANIIPSVKMGIVCDMHVNKIAPSVMQEYCAIGPYSMFGAYRNSYAVLLLIFMCIMINKMTEQAVKYTPDVPVRLGLVLIFSAIIMSAQGYMYTLIYSTNSKNMFTTLFMCYNGVIFIMTVSGVILFLWLFYNVVEIVWKKVPSIISSFIPKEYKSYLITCRDIILFICTILLFQGIFILYLNYIPGDFGVLIDTASTVKDSSRLVLQVI